MKSLVNSTKGRLIVLAAIVALILGVCFACFATANAADEAEQNGDRTINFTKFTLIGGRIHEDKVTIPAEETATTFKFVLGSIKPGESGENEQGDLYDLFFTCGNYKVTLTAEFYHEGQCSDIAFYDSYGVMHLLNEEMDFSVLDPYGTGSITLSVMFYGQNLYLGYVYGSPINKHSYFDLTVNIPGTDIPVSVSTAAAILGFDWPWGDYPSYIYEMLSADQTIVSQRPYEIDEDGTLHVRVGVGDVDTKLNATAVGKSGAVFKNWVLNGNVLPNGSSGITPEPQKIDENLYGYELVATFYSDEELVTVNFDSQGGSAVDSQTIEKGEKATKPADPTKDNCRFDGWYTDAACTSAFDFNTAIQDNITLYAKWIELPHIIEGADAVWYFGSTEGLTFKSTAKTTDFLRVTVDGDEVDSTAYTLGTDETIVLTLSASYLNLMKDGAHELGIVSNFVANEEYTETCTFTTTVQPIIPVVDPTSAPQTGDVVLWFGVLFAILGLEVFAAQAIRRKRNSK